MATEMKRASLVIVTSSVFERGIEDGIIWHCHVDTPGRPMTEDDVIDFLTGNFIELALEGHVDALRLRSNGGFLIGWLGAQAHVQVLPLSPGS